MAEFCSGEIEMTGTKEAPKMKLHFFLKHA